MTSVTAPPPPAPYLPQRGERYRLVAPNAPTAPKIVRDFVATVLWATGHPRLVDDARLCASEVVSNAYCHTDSPQVRVEVTVNRRQVTVYVTDDEPGRLPARTPGAETGADEGGRGLLLVEGLAARWGTTAYGARSPHSKTVWFTLSASGG
ncbi:MULTISPECIES: ATP-binding protein [unclassified Streptomyces]|uniref:ATP-binding protein n=1 Tax=unclassified Streptomyces TaxID=2593676 RepID=UPI0022598CBE|nr:ATP-binding protein [Streptomyces sp. NBC_01363]MCX4730261.1 ATP-binding protein [Streptomyces sp. NBC_01363]